MGHPNLIKKLSDEILFLFLSLDVVPWNSVSGGFACFWQSKCLGIIAIKTEGTQIHFLSDVLVAVALLNLKVPIICMYYNPQKFSNFHMQVFQINPKYHCLKPIKLQKFLMQ